MSLHPIRRALLSVSDKTGLLELARALAGRQVELISTGGTRQALADAGLAVREVSEVTGMPEMLDGRVKTLHPHIHGGILAVRDNALHQLALETHGIQPIDLVVCNLYPFEATLARSGSTPEEIIENIDIGGPTLVRAAAKNFHDVAVLTDPAQYAEVLQEFQQNQGALSLPTRRRLAAAAFARIAAYDQAISAYFAGQQGEEEQFPPVLHRQWRHRLALRYGENPHQKAAFYIDFDSAQPGVASAQVLHGKELSYKNILDLDSALNLVREFSAPAAAVIKHNNPCGAAVAATLSEAFQLAYEGDPLSAFGGVLAFNRELDEATAQRIADPKRYIECIIAAGYSPAALQILTGWKKNVRLLSTGPLEGPGAGLVLRQVGGGVLVQEPDRNNDQSDFHDLRVVTRRQPTETELADLQLAWVVCKHVKSNAIVLVKAGAVVGVGAGQMSRVDSVRLAVGKAGSRSQGAVLASDAFFPFADNVEEAARAGVTALVQPGGSLRDEESIQACDRHNLAMAFTGVRHFRH